MFEGNGCRWEKGNVLEVHSAEVSWTHDLKVGKKGDFVDEKQHLNVNFAEGMGWEK